MTSEKDNHAKHVLRRMDRDMLADAAIALIRHLQRNSTIDEETLKAMLHLKGVLTLNGYQP